MTHSRTLQELNSGARVDYAAANPAFNDPDWFPSHR